MYISSVNITFCWVSNKIIYCAGWYTKEYKIKSYIFQKENFQKYFKQKFKSFEELKKDFDELRLAVKTDIEIMNGILESYKELMDDKVPVTEEIQDQQITMLTDLEYLLHQIDNANEFVKSGG